MPPAGEVGLTWLKTLTSSLTWVGSVPIGDKRLTIEPSISFYNLFNFANFNSTGNVLSGVLTGTPGSINGTSPSFADTNSVRIGAGTGVFNLGAPRTIEFGLKFTF